jgi:GNAT superfamily N-acetyltransferase
MTTGSERMWRVRPARLADRAALVPLWQENDVLHARLMPGFFRRARGAPDGRVGEALDESLRDGSHALLVADDESGSPRGAAEVQIYDAPAADVIVPVRRAHLENLVVAPTHRRQGCGRALVEAAAAWARRRGAVELVLTVWAGNEDAERFYERLGYRCISRVLGTTL